MHNEEVNIVVFGAEFGQAMEHMFKSDVDATLPIQAPNWARRSLWARLQEWSARIWAYWF
ncbi:MAG: hypothetical protein ACYDC8_05920 [Gammaproteobacteria bacterium]